jgi:hypothetical protein
MEAMAQWNDELIDCRNSRFTAGQFSVISLPAPCSCKDEKASP